jgi:hypothetical protein
MSSQGRLGVTHVPPKPPTTGQAPVLATEKRAAAHPKPAVRHCLVSLWNLVHLLGEYLLPSLFHRPHQRVIVATGTCVLASHTRLNTELEKEQFKDGDLVEHVVPSAERVPER